MHSQSDRCRVACHEDVNVTTNKHFNDCCQEDTEHDVSYITSQDTKSTRQLSSHHSSSLTTSLNTGILETCESLLNIADPDEAEILALLSDEIPKYRIQSDSLTDLNKFSSIDSRINDGPTWEEYVALSPKPTDEALNYHVVCAERVSQMTKSFSDAEVVTHLLEEKERDLELAARIGQTLLSKNKELNSQIDALEEQLIRATDTVNQLKHNLSVKDQLIKCFSDDLELETSKDLTLFKSGSESCSVEFLEKKVKLLEDENFKLRLEGAQLKTETDNYEEKEKKLVEDCIQQLSDVNLQVESLAEELCHKTEESIHHREEANQLLLRMTGLQTKIRKLTVENMDIRERLSASTQSQQQLTIELGTMHDKYDELLEMMQTAQDELRLLKNRNKQPGHDNLQDLDSTDSLASELENSLQKELSLSRPNSRGSNWKVFETAKLAKQAAAKAVMNDASSGVRMSLAPSSQPESSSKAPSFYTSDVESLAYDSCCIDEDTLYESNSELGRPGIPGTNDLESALKRLALRRANEQNEKVYRELEKKQNKFQTDMHDGTGSNASHKSRNVSFHHSPAENSLLSSSDQQFKLPETSNQHFKLPEKLQIVKPLEGSLTLMHWQQLAQPHLAGIFEEREGIQLKGAHNLYMHQEVNSMNDYLDNDHSHDIHTRREQDLGLICTITNSTVRNPGNLRSLPVFRDGTTESHDVKTLSCNSKTPQSQRTPQEDNTCSTYSMSLGLAALLQDRETPQHSLIRASTLKHSLIRASSPEHSLVRVSTPQLASTTCTSSTIVPSWNLNQTPNAFMSFESQPLTSSTPKISLESRSHNFVTVAKEDKVFLVPESESRVKLEQATAENSGKGLLQHLKDKGYSWYSLLGAGTGSRVESQQSDLTRNTDGDRTFQPDDSHKSQALTESVFESSADSSILNALTNLRRGGF